MKAIPEAESISLSKLTGMNEIGFIEGDDRTAKVKFSNNGLNVIFGNSSLPEEHTTDLVDDVRAGNDVAPFDNRNRSLAFWIALWRQERIEPDI